MFSRIYNHLFSYPQSEPSKVQEELDKRSELFPKLSETEIERRSKIILNRNDNIENNRESILEAMVQTLRETKPDAPYIIFDFRYYSQGVIKWLRAIISKKMINITLIFSTNRFSLSPFMLY